jgi:hypothetical protein
VPDSCAGSASVFADGLSSMSHCVWLIVDEVAGSVVGRP